MNELHRKRKEAWDVFHAILRAANSAISTLRNELDTRESKSKRDDLLSRIRK